MATNVILNNNIEDSWLKFYNLTEFLGSGSYGGVYKAEHKFTKELCAVKITYLQKQSFDNNSDAEQARAKMRREFLLPFGKEHKNIVNVYEGLETKISEHEVEKLLESLTNSENREAKRNKSKLEFWSGESGLDTLFISMELCGITLRQSITTTQELETELCEAQESIIRGIAKGLFFLHKNKILHRDLKSENIFFAHGPDKYHVKIGDFGIGRIIHTDESKTSAQTLKPVTTPLYRAPELESDTAEYTLQADLFSLGLIIYEVLKMLKSRKPDFTTIRNPTSSLELPTKPFENAVEIVLGLTEMDTTKRFKTVGEMKLKELSKITGQKKQRLLLSTVTLQRRRYSAKEFLQIVDNYISLIGHPDGGTMVAGDVDLSYGNRVITNIVFRSNVKISGNSNELSNIIVVGEENDILDRSIEVSGSENILNNIKVYMLVLTIAVNGNRNTISNVSLTEDSDLIDYTRCDVDLKSGVGHTVKNVSESMCNIQLHDSTSLCRVETCDYVGSVSGMNHIFSDCDFDESLISGDCHKFTKCKGSLWNSSDTNCEFTDCSLEFIVSSESDSSSEPDSETDTELSILSSEVN